MAGPVDFQDITDVVNRVKGVDGIRSASIEVSEVKTPGVFVKVLGFTFDRHKGYTLNTQLVLLVDDTSPTRAAKKLVALLNLVLTVFTPSGPVTARTVVTPNAPGGLPGLVVPVDVITVPS